MVLDQHFWIDSVGMTLLLVIAWFIRAAWASNTEALKEMAGELHQVGTKLASHDTAIALSDERNKRRELEGHELRKNISDIWNVLAKNRLISQVRKADKPNE
jgi:hypothetical protein